MVINAFVSSTGGFWHVFGLGEATIYWIVACTTTSWEVVLWAHHVLWNLAIHWIWTGQVETRRWFCWWPLWDGEKRDPSKGFFDLQPRNQKVTNWITWSCIIMKIMKHSWWWINSHTTFDIQGTLHELEMFCEVSCRFRSENPWRWWWNRSRFTVKLEGKTIENPPLSAVLWCANPYWHFLKHVFV